MMCPATCAWADIVCLLVLLLVLSWVLPPVVPAGSYLVFGSTAELCPKGTFKATVGPEACTPCIAGATTVSSGATSQSMCTGMRECVVGKLSGWQAHHESACTTSGSPHIMRARGLQHNAYYV